MFAANSKYYSDYGTYANSTVLEMPVDFKNYSAKKQFDEIDIQQATYWERTTELNQDFLDELDARHSSINDLIDSAHDFRLCFRYLILVFESFIKSDPTKEQLYRDVISSLERNIQSLCSSGGTGLINVHNSHELQKNNLQNMIDRLNADAEISNTSISNLDTPIEVSKEDGIPSGPGFKLMQTKILNFDGGFNTLKESGKSIESAFANVTPLKNGVLNEIDGCVGEACPLPHGTLETWICPLFGCMKARVESILIPGKTGTRNIAKSTVYMKYNVTNEIYVFEIEGPVVLDDVVALLGEGRSRKGDREEARNIKFVGKLSINQSLDKYFIIGGEMDNNFFQIPTPTTSMFKYRADYLTSNFYGVEVPPNLPEILSSDYGKIYEKSRIGLAMIGLKTMCDKRLFKPIKSSTLRVHGYSTVDEYVIIAYVIAYLLRFIPYVPYMFYSGGSNTYSVYSFDESNDDLYERYCFFYNYMSVKESRDDIKNSIKKTDKFIEFNERRLFDNNPPIRSLWEYITCKTIANQRSNWDSIKLDLLRKLENVSRILGEYSVTGKDRKAQLIESLSKIPKRIPTINDICLELFKHEDVFLVDETPPADRKLRIKRELYAATDYLKHVKGVIVSDAAFQETLKDIDETDSAFSDLTAKGHEGLIRNVPDAKTKKMLQTKLSEKKPTFLSLFKFNGSNIYIQDGYIIFEFDYSKGKNDQLTTWIKDYNEQEFVADNEDEKLILLTDIDSGKDKFKIPFRLETVLQIISNFPGYHQIPTIHYKGKPDPYSFLPAWLFDNFNEPEFEKIVKSTFNDGTLSKIQQNKKVNGDISQRTAFQTATYSKKSDYYLGEIFNLGTIDKLNSVITKTNEDLVIKFRSQEVVLLGNKLVKPLFGVVTDLLGLNFTHLPERALNELERDFIDTIIVNSKEFNKREVDALFNRLIQESYSSPSRMDVFEHPERSDLKPFPNPRIGEDMGTSLEAVESPDSVSTSSNNSMDIVKMLPSPPPLPPTIETPPRSFSPPLLPPNTNGFLTYQPPPPPLPYNNFLSPAIKKPINLQQNKSKRSYNDTEPEPEPGSPREKKQNTELVGGKNKTKKRIQKRKTRKVKKSKKQIRKTYRKK